MPFSPNSRCRCHPHQPLVAPREKMPAKLVANVEPLGIDPKQPFHFRNQVGSGRFKTASSAESVGEFIGFGEPS